MDSQDLISLLSSLGLRNVTRRGNNVMFSCPNTYAHPRGDQRPSCGMRMDDPHPWGCFSCEIKGKTLYSFLVGQMGKSVRQARLICGKEELSVDPRELTLTINSSGKTVLTYDEDELFVFYPSKRSDLYFKLRGLSPSTVKALSLMYDKATDRAIYPWFFDEKLVAVTGRALTPAVASKEKSRSFLQGMDKRSLVYLPNRRIERGACVLVEGEFDSAKVFEAGFRNVAAICQAHLSDRQKTFLVESEAEEFLIFTDDDEAGRAVAKEIDRKISPFRKVRVIDYSPIRAFYRHLTKRGKKLDPGALDVADIQRLLSANPSTLFSSWSKISSCFSSPR